MSLTLLNLIVTHERGVTVVASTLRDPRQERSTVETLIAHNIDALLIAGATDPDSVAELCEKAHLKAAFFYPSRIFVFGCKVSLTAIHCP